MLASKEMGAFYHLFASEDAKAKPPIECDEAKEERDANGEDETVKISLRFAIGFNPRHYALFPP